MFVKSKRFGSIPKTYFIYDKELPKGNILERLVNPFPKRFDNPKGNSAYKIFSIMSKEKNFVAKNTVCIQVTPAQQKLLQLITPVEAEDFYKSLKHVHYLATYCVDKDFLDEIWKHAYMHQLLDVLQAYHLESDIQC